MMIGAILGGASEEEGKRVEEIASAVGLAFQIQDDILDVTSTSEELGKPVLSDEKNQKTTYVTLVGLDQARADVAEISARAVSLLKELPGENPFLENLITMLVERKNRRSYGSCKNHDSGTYRRSVGRENLSQEELKTLAAEIRQFLIEKISVTGGHLASNLGVVELTIALYLAFDLPKDKVIWDVGHQSYTHKILSGRRRCLTSCGSTAA